MDFVTLEEKIHRAKNTVRNADAATITLCFDPGHTTGYAIFKGLELIDSGEIVTKPIEEAARNISAYMQLYTPDIVVLESYTVYKWRAKHHGGSELLTARVIGCIETFCVIQAVDMIIKQPAHIGKGFCTNTRLKEWGFYKPGMKHACDAIRHGCYFLLFGAINPKDTAGHTVG